MKFYYHAEFDATLLNGHKYSLTISDPKGMTYQYMWSRFRDFMKACGAIPKAMPRITAR